DQGAISHHSVASSPAPVSGIELLQVLDALPLLNQAQREQLVRNIQAQPSADAAALAALMVERGWLTPFQTRQILAGRMASLVLGRLVLTDLLGQGGMSQVFRAYDTVLRRWVAIKVLRPSLIREAGEETMQRFFREMEAVGRVQHPNLVAAYDAGTVGST